MQKNTVCLDTNILIDLSKVYYASENVSMTLEENFINYSHYKRLEYLLNLIERHEIEIIILPMVLFEADHVSRKKNFRTMEFLSEFKHIFKVLTYDHSKIKGNLTLIDEIARIYCKETTVITKKSKKLKLEPVFENFSESPSNDAIIMAEGAILDYNLITRDRHFLDEKKPIRIANINNFFVKNSARPYSLKDYMHKKLGLTYADYLRPTAKPVFQKTFGTCLEA